MNLFAHYFAIIASNKMKIINNKQHRTPEQYQKEVKQEVTLCTRFQPAKVEYNKKMKK